MSITTPTLRMPTPNNNPQMDVLKSLLPVLMTMMNPNKSDLILPGYSGTMPNVGNAAPPVPAAGAPAAGDPNADKQSKLKMLLAKILPIAAAGGLGALAGGGSGGYAGRGRGAADALGGYMDQKNLMDARKEQTRQYEMSRQDQLAAMKLKEEEIRHTRKKEEFKMQQEEAKQQFDMMQAMAAAGIDTTAQKTADKVGRASYDMRGVTPANSQGVPQDIIAEAMMQGNTQWHKPSQEAAPNFPGITVPNQPIRIPMSPADDSGSQRFMEITAQTARELKRRTEEQYLQSMRKLQDEERLKAYYRDNKPSSSGSIEQQAMNQWIAEDPANRNALKWMEKQAKEKESSNMVNMPTLTGENIEARLNELPLTDRNVVKALVEYRRQPVGGFATKDPQWKRWLAMAYAVDPNYDEKEYQSRQKIVNSFTSGNDYKQLQAVNTLANHLDTLGEASLALKNGDIQKLNQIANFVGVQTGKTPVTTLKAIVHRIGPEVTKAYVGTGGEFSERKENEGDFSGNMSPDQILSNVKITVKLLGGKIESQAHGWKTGMNRQEFALRDGGPGFVSPEAQAAFDKWGEQPTQSGTIEMIGPKGKFTVTKDQQKIMEENGYKVVE